MNNILTYIHFKTEQFNIASNSSPLFLAGLIILAVIWYWTIRITIRKYSNRQSDQTNSQGKSQTGSNIDHEEYCRLTNNIPVAIFQYKIDSGKHSISFISKKVEDIFNISNDTSLPEWSELKAIHPDDRGTLKSSAEKALISASNWYFEGRLIDKNGQEHKFKANSSLNKSNGNIRFEGILMPSEQGQEEELKQNITTLRRLIARTSSKNGEAFFLEIAQAVNEVAKANYTFIGVLNKKYDIDTIAFCSQNSIEKNFTYSPIGKSCALHQYDANKKYCKNEIELFPTREFFDRLKIRNYIGTALYNKNGDKIGILMSMFADMPKERNALKSAFEIFSSSIASEIQRNQTEEALRKSETNLKRVIEASPVAIAISSPSNQILSLNNKFVELFGYTNEDINSMNDWVQKAYPDEKYRKHIIDKWQKSMENYLTNGTFSKLASRVFCKNRSKRNIEINFTSLPEANITTFVDLTEQKRVERELSQEKEFSEKIVNSLPGIFYLFMNTGDKYRLVRWNTNHQKETGYSNEELFGLSPEELIEFEENLSLTSVAKILTPGKNIKQEGLLKRKSKKKKPFYFSARVFRDQNMDFFMGVGLDISERLKMEKELEAHKKHLELLVKERTEELAKTNSELSAANKELHSTNEELNNQKEELEKTIVQLHYTQSQLIQSEKLASLGILTAGIAHEINNPVNYINASVYGLNNFIEGFSLIYKKYGQLTQQNQKVLMKEIENLKEQYDFDFMYDNLTSTIQNIGNGAKRIAAIIKGLRTFSSQNDNQKEHIDIHEHIDATLAMLQHEMKDKIEIKKSYGNIPLTSCFPGKINQVLMNLIVNSIHAINNQHGQITITTRIAKKKKHIDILISDTGTGIPEDIRTKIFEPFFTTKTLGKGTGLGLYICHNIVKEHKGDLILLESSKSGTTFCISLPI